MKKLYSLPLKASVVLALIISYLPVKAQIEVGNTNNVGVGSLFSNAKLHIDNSSENYSLLVNSDPNGLANMEGITNEMIGTITGSTYAISNNISTSSSFLRGLFNDIDGTGNKTGVYNDLTGNNYSNSAIGMESYFSGNNWTRTGIKTTFSGNSGSARGIHNHMAGTVGTSEIGVYNYSNSSKSGSFLYKYGMQNTILENDANGCFGILNTLITTGNVGQAYGIANTLSVNGSGSYYGLRNNLTFNRGNATGVAYGVSCNLTGTSSSGVVYGIHSYLAPGVSGLAGYFSGDVTVTGTFTNGSDSRLKYDVEKMDSSLEIILQLSPKRYKFITNKQNLAKKDKSSFGFIAQDVMKVIPDIVTSIYHPGEEKEEIGEEAREEVLLDGTKIQHPEIKKYVPAKGEDRYAIAYLELIPFLVGAIQEQNVQLQALSESKDRFSMSSPGNFDDLEEQLVAARKQVEELSNRVDVLMACSDCDDSQLTLKTRQIDLEIDQLDIKIYPNPVTNILNIATEAESTGLLELSIFNSSGERVGYEQSMLIEGKNVHQLNVSTWTAGTYFVTTTFKGVSTSNKVIVE